MTHSAATFSSTSSEPRRRAQETTSAANPGTLGVVERVKAALGESAGRALSRPRFLRGPYLEKPVDATPIVTHRLTLRAHRTGDVEEWFALQSDPDVVRYLSWEVRDRRASRAHLRTRTRHTRLWQTDDFLAMAIEYDGKLIGDISLQVRTVATAVRSVEMGWVLDPFYQGHGYATEAANAMLDLAFTEVDARMVTAVIDRRNHRSLALAERLGFRELTSDASDHVMVVTPATRA